ncbi:MAG TPA: L,D-transpeptidase family protein [Candidatus Sulfotelmatobacter sp.]|nr:L,D-transpeptidase family protein [Candidatus Sulfotelmatobacter sp.]
MRIRVLTGLMAWLLYAAALAGAAEKPLHADRVVVLKRERTLQLLSQGKVIKSYKVALGGDPVGPKTRQGDHKTPEGEYALDSRNAHSQFYRSIHISYPSAKDRAVGRQKGVSPDGDVFVHGLPNGYGWVGASHRLKDWTDGCIAVTNEEMDEIWIAVTDGTPIEIRP